MLPEERLSTAASRPRVRASQVKHRQQRVEALRPSRPLRQDRRGEGEADFLIRARKAEYRGIADRLVRFGLVLAEIDQKNNIKVTGEERVLPRSPG
jgi:FKBP-type peptidyl-prolyl cis-trans isomerase (trigger factor)